jgi:tRNA dimethylallyltransferase
MLDAGLLEETRRLLQSGVSPDCQSMQAIGYKELVQYLTESCSYAQAVEMLKRNTRRYAKRR